MDKKERGNLKARRIKLAFQYISYSSVYRAIFLHKQHSKSRQNNADIIFLLLNLQKHMP